MDRLVLLDMNNTFWRSFHGVSNDLSTKTGRATWGVHGSLMVMSSIIRRIEPTYVLACFDGGRSEYRTRLYPEYKNRPHADGHETGSEQLRDLEFLVQEMGVPAQKVKGVEADDLIATHAIAYMDEVDEVVIVSGDKDLRQLIRSNVTVFAPALGKGGQEVLWDRDKVVEHYGGISPDRLPDLFALMGDASDNIPGVPGVGEKRATLMIQKHGSLSNVMLAEEPKVVGHEREAALWFRLVYLAGNLTHPIPLDDLKFQPVTPKDEGGPQLAEQLAGLELQKIEDMWRAGELWAETVKFGRRLRPDPLRAAV